MRRLFGALLLPVLAVGCAAVRLPATPPSLAPAYALAAPEQGQLAEYGERIGSRLAGGESAYWLLAGNGSALDARLALTDEAVSTLDLQYFIWETDATGRLLLQRVIDAADRGVRVRLLVDDFSFDGMDEEIAALDAHPAIEVRVFNPWRHRASTVIKAFEFFRRFRQLNHRMHNKVYIADSRFAIIGGRNIGNRYFGVNEDFVQNDIDVMIAGPLLEDVSASFDLFWNSHLVYDGSVFSREGRGAELLDRLVAEVDAEVAGQTELLDAFPLERVDWVGYLQRLIEDMKSGPGEFLYDLPYVDTERPDQLYGPLKTLIRGAENEVLISSAYFIPDQDFLASLHALTERGIRVAILTNSLASNNHAIAHAGYKRMRRAILEKGIELYELRHDARSINYYVTSPAEVRALGLHSKAAVVDRERVFIGSPNVDPRSLLLNTEVGVIVDDAALAAEVAHLLIRDMAAENAWKVTLEGRGLRWTNSDEQVGKQPATGLIQRSAGFFWSLMPFKGQL